MYLLVLALENPNEISLHLCQKSQEVFCFHKFLIFFDLLYQTKSLQPPYPVLLVASQTSRYRSNGGVWQKVWRHCRLIVHVYLNKTKKTLHPFKWAASYALFDISSLLFQWFITPPGYTGACLYLKSPFKGRLKNPNGCWQNNILSIVNTYQCNHLKTAKYIN